MVRINKPNKATPVSADKFIIYNSEDTSDDKSITLGQVATFTENQNSSIAGTKIFQNGVELQKGSIAFGQYSPLPTGIGSYIAQYTHPTYGVRLLGYNGLAYQDLNIGSMPTAGSFSIKSLANGDCNFGYNTNITGNCTANKFYGDGSNLTNIKAVVPLGTCTTPSNDSTLTGTVTATAGSTTVTGSGTNFVQECPAGSTIVINGTPCLVSSVASNTSLTLSQAYANVNYSGAAYKANLIKVITGVDNFNFQDGAQLDVIFTNPNLGLTGLGFSIKGTTYLCSKGGNAINDTNVAYYPAGYRIPFKYNATNKTFDLQNVKVDSYASSISWWDLYADGKIEEGGFYSGTSAVVQVILLKQMKTNTYYIGSLGDNNPGVAGSFMMITANSQTSTGFSVVINYAPNYVPSIKIFRWEAKGY